MNAVHQIRQVLNSEDMKRNTANKYKNLVFEERYQELSGAYNTEIPEIQESETCRNALLSKVEGMK